MVVLWKHYRKYVRSERTRAGSFEARRAVCCILYILFFYWYYFSLLLEYFIHTVGTTTYLYLFKTYLNVFLKNIKELLGRILIERLNELPIGKNVLLLVEHFLQHTKFLFDYTFFILIESTCWWFCSHENVLVVL